ncbi:MAG: hypothetical protein WAU78_00890 [Roseiarcus sp.]
MSAPELVALRAAVAGALADLDDDIDRLARLTADIDLLIVRWSRHRARMAAAREVLDAPKRDQGGGHE